MTATQTLVFSERTTDTLERPNFVVAVSEINVVSHPRAWIGITVAVAAAAAFALANTSAMAYHGAVTR